MDTTYFIIIDGRQHGPFSREELAARSLRPETPVWREGLENWVEASTLPELADILAAGQPTPPYPGQQAATQAYTQQPVNSQPYGQPQYGQPSQYGGQQYGQQPGPYGQPRPYEQAPIPHTNWLPWAIVVTVLGCCSLSMVCGIIGIVYANKANGFYNAGLRMQGDDSNSTACIWTIIGIVLLSLSFVATILLWTVGGLAEILRSID